MDPVLIDSNILNDIFSDNPEWNKWSRDNPAYLSLMTNHYINPVIYSGDSPSDNYIPGYHQ